MKNISKNFLLTILFVFTFQYSKAIRAVDFYQNQYLVGSEQVNNINVNNNISINSANDQSKTDPYLVSHEMEYNRTSNTVDFSTQQDKSSYESSKNSNIYESQQNSNQISKEINSVEMTSQKSVVDFSTNPTTTNPAGNNSLIGPDTGGDPDAPLNSFLYILFFAALFLGFYPKLFIKTK